MFHSSCCSIITAIKKKDKLSGETCMMNINFVGGNYELNQVKESPESFASEESDDHFCTRFYFSLDMCFRLQKNFESMGETMLNGDESVSVSSETGRLCLFSPKTVNNIAAFLKTNSTEFISKIKSLSYDDFADDEDASLEVEDLADDTQIYISSEMQSLFNFFIICSAKNHAVVIY